MNTMDRAAYLARINAVNETGRFGDSWGSLSRYRTPDWFRDAKFGIFIHWGVYSVPAFGSEWYSRNMYIQGSREFEHHVKTYGPQKDFGYKDLLNIGPRADGTITDEDKNITCRGGHIYAIALSYPENGEVAFPALGERDASSKPNFHGHIKNVTALGSDETPEWSRREDALHVKTKRVRSEAPVVFRVEVE